MKEDSNKSPKAEQGKKMTEPRDLGGIDHLEEGEVPEKGELSDREVSYLRGTPEKEDKLAAETV